MPPRFGPGRHQHHRCRVETPGKLADLKKLRLGGTRVDGSGLAVLPAPDRLEILELQDTEAADASLVHVARFTNLKRLDLAGSRVNGRGLNNLTRLPQLEWLSLASSRLTDAGLENLRGPIHLRSLILKNTAVGDAARQHLAAADECRRSRSQRHADYRCRAGPPGSLNGLAFLDISQTGITDAGLRRLATLTKFVDLKFAARESPTPAWPWLAR